MLFKELETDRLLLKCISSEDRGFLLTQFSCDEVNRYLFDAEPLADIQDADEIIDFYIQPEPRNQHRWILIRKDDRAKLGTCGFHCWNRTDNCCDVGYDLYPDFWGNGYMSEAMQAILSFAKDEMGIKRIDACIYIENDASLKLAKNLGFVFKGKMRDEIFRGIAYPHKILTLDFSGE